MHHTPCKGDRSLARSRAANMPDRVPRRAASVKHAPRRELSTAEAACVTVIGASVARGGRATMRGAPPRCVALLKWARRRDVDRQSGCT